MPDHSHNETANTDLPMWQITWNPGISPWNEYKQQSEATRCGDRVTCRWTCGNTHAAVGDEVFMVKLGATTPPCGIIAHGRIVRAPYSAPHYNAEKAAAGKTAYYADIEFDRILDYDTERILDMNELNARFTDPKQNWTAQSSGTEIKAEIRQPLRQMWAELLRRAEYYPSLQEYAPGISKEQWLEILRSPGLLSKNKLRMLKMMLQQGGESTCANLAETYGGSSASYNMNGTAIGQLAYQFTNCRLFRDEKGDRYYTIPFLGRSVIERGLPRYSWKLRPELQEALEEMDLSDIDLTVRDVDETVFSEFDKNIILYGPPGTGKTYNTAVYAVAICDGRPLADVQKQDYAETFRRYEELKADGRVVFTTFHQSYGYEEFIEGIKPVIDKTGSDIGYQIAPGVFKRFCKAASGPEYDVSTFTGKVWNVRSRAGDKDVPFDYKAYLVEHEAIIIEDIEDTNRQCDSMKKMAKGDLVVLGRESAIYAIGVVAGNELTKIDQAPFRWMLPVKWLLPRLDMSFADIGKSDMIISNFAIANSKLTADDILPLLRETAKKPHVFIIDEINRGNISKIFGELITLIEDTKRQGMPEEASAVLPYSGERFSVPANICLLGTMNTADRSIAMMDTALRRRFRFVEMMPDIQVLKDNIPQIDGLDVAEMLAKINERIAFLYDREHMIGHAFFMKLKAAPNVSTLAEIFRNSIIPLLQEYFYEDYQKIQLVLGDNAKKNDAHKFILNKTVETQRVFNGNVDFDIPKMAYSINGPTDEYSDPFENIESYQQIL